MERNQKINNRKKNNDLNVLTFPVQLPLNKIQDDFSILLNGYNDRYRDEIISKAFKYHSKGNISEAIKYYKYFIDKGFIDARVFANYGIILNDLGKIQEAEKHTRQAIKLNPKFVNAYYNLGIILKNLRKYNEAEYFTRIAIQLNPNFSDAYNNLGSILIDLGKRKEARESIEKSLSLNPKLAEAYNNLASILIDLGELNKAKKLIHKSIDIKPDLTRAYFSLSMLPYSNENSIWKDHLFSETILHNKSLKDKSDIYFARANILHNEQKYKLSSINLDLANKISSKLLPSNVELLLTKSKKLLRVIEGVAPIEVINTKSNQSIFIVGMPRCGSTLLESILTMNSKVDDLGEVNIFEESYLESGFKGEIKEKKKLNQLYFTKIRELSKSPYITTNKMLYNYQYAGMIAMGISNCKIIHCFRNPLDNILSIYRAHFTKGNEYSSSLFDIARVYLDHQDVMSHYKNRFRSKIFDLNYDLLVKEPAIQIKKLISWLSWKWNDHYLSPHLNDRVVLTASSVQVRSPINPKSVGGWKNYSQMLEPAIKVLRKDKNFKNTNA
tara:strand:+ start:2290 stop:3954 length:1665 start_codon:yes stop_codon:yes gene_type:complete